MDDVTASVSCACAVHVCELVNLDIISVNYLHTLVDYMYIYGVSKSMELSIITSDTHTSCLLGANGSTATE